MSKTAPTSKAATRATKKQAAPKAAQKQTSKKDTSSSPITPNTKLTIQLPWAEIQPAYQKVLASLAQKVKLPGFRLGKAPLKLAEGAIGQTKLIEATLDKLLPAAYQDLIIKHHKRPLTQPDIRPVKLNWDEDWELSVEIAEQPTIKLGSYQSIIKKALLVAQKELDEQKKTAPQTKHLDNHHDHDHSHADGHHHGHQPDPKETKLRHVFAALVSDLKPTVPELLLREETRREIQELARSLEQIKMSLEDYLQRRQLTSEQLTNELAGTVLTRLQLEFILAAITEDQKLTATQADVEAQLNAITDVQLQEQQRNNQEYRSYLLGILSRQKTVDWLLEQSSNSP